VVLHRAGVSVPEPVLHEAYLMMPDLSPVMGWETGRRSEPAFMDMNLHAIRDASEPRVVLFQFDEADPMNPRGLLIAYAEECVKPVVSDFDTFTVASKNMCYEPVPEDQQKIVMWMLEHAENVLKTPDHNPWTVRWLEVLKKEGERGFHPRFPKYGFGDPTSYKLIGDIVTETKACGAIRHGAECFNYYFPQELDDEYLIVWDGFPEKPWKYHKEEEMRNFLLSRMDEGFGFPMNPLWPVRDQGWWEVWEKCLETARGESIDARTNRKNLASWYSEKLGVMDTINSIRKSCPKGFIQSADLAQDEPKPKEEKKPPAEMKKAPSIKKAESPAGNASQGGAGGEAKGGFMSRIFGRKR